MKSKLRAALVAAVGLVCAPVGAAADNITISGVYSFVASNFGKITDIPLHTVALDADKRKFGFTYTYAPDNPPLSGNDPLIIPSRIDLTFGSTTFSTNDLRLSITLYDVSQPVDQQGERLDLRLEARDQHHQRSGDYFLLEFALMPGQQHHRALYEA